MLPIFKKYIKFLKEKNKELDFLKEGIYWCDRSIIKAFDKKGNIIKIARLKIDDDLNLEIKKYKNKNIELETWEDTINRNLSHLNDLENKSKETICKYLNKYSNRKIAILSSGGKDSTITTYLVKKCIDNPRIIFNNTSLDCTDTYRHIKKENNLIIINPKEGFYQWRKRLNFVPTRFARACCNIFKEGAMIEYLDKNDKYLFFMGMRNQESVKRSNYTDEWKNDKWKDREWNAILPIREWSELDVWLYVLKNNIDINPKYKKGYSRVGCAIACPYYAKSTWILDKYWYPKMYDRWHKILTEDFISNNKDIIMNCTEKEYHICWNGGKLRDKPTQEVIEQFAERERVDVDVAKNYFNHNCKECGKKIKNKNVLAMNMKFNGRNIQEMYCKKHLKEKLNLTEDDWNNYIEQFKNQGCELF
jgi:3'-phosphoadenosine 5'-phosphosulfate sulfotransferase (PAPS reductase)/FAD synthetase